MRIPQNPIYSVNYQLVSDSVAASASFSQALAWDLTNIDNRYDRERVPSSYPSNGDCFYRQSTTTREKAAMQKLTIRLLTPLLLLVLSAASLAADIDRARPERLGMSSERLERLDAVLKSYVDNDQVAGQVVMVLRRGRIAYASANGMQDIEAGIPMSEDTMFRIASQTKAIVSTGIMILHERGALDISHNLERYIPEWADMQVAVANDDGSYKLEPARRSITLRNLLTHTGGMSYGSGPAADEWKAAGFQGWYFADRDEPVADTIARMASLPLDEHPGERWIYGYNTDILGAVIEKASGMDLNSFLKTSGSSHRGRQ